MHRFRLTLLATALLALCDAAFSQGPAAASPSGAAGLAVPIGYVGPDARVGLSVDLHGRVQGEALGVFGYDERRAVLVDGWLGSGSSGGLKAGYHWLWGGAASADDMARRSNEIVVAKVFAAADRNRFGDRKASLGLGLEKNAYSLDVYVSRALSHERLINSSANSTVEVIQGNEGGRPYQQTITTRSLFEQFEHPYERGVGVRVARSFEGQLLRLHAGLDYETGRALLAGRRASQLAFTLGLDKQFHGSGHSVGFGVEHLRKDGPFDTAQYGGKRDDSRLFVRWRYDFGPSFRPPQTFRERQVVTTVQAPPAPPPEVVRTELKLASAALFEFDRSELREEAKLELRPLIAAMQSKRVGAISVVGHTCDIGSDAYNQALSERRAAAVGAWLIAEGVPADAVLTSGSGESTPEVPNDSEDNRARNRRVVLSFASFAEKVIQKEAEPRQIIETVLEPVAMPAAWIARALRTPSDHKRAVDTYRIERVTETRTVGPREFANRPPVAADDQALVTDSRPVIINVLQNDSDPDGDALTVALVTPPTRGAVTIDARGVATYTPGASFAGSDTFRYSVTDPSGLSASATVTLGGTNRAPVAVNDSGTWSDSDPVTVNVLANDSDPDGDVLTVAITRPPAGGSARVNADRTITYTPDPSGSFPTVTLDYTVTDPGGRSATATVTLTTGGATNRAPIAANDSGTWTDGDPVTVNVLANDSDPDGDTLTVVITRPPAAGSAQVNADKTITYRPDLSGNFPMATFDYTVTDPGGRSATATVTLTTGGATNRAPIAANDSGTWSDGDPVTVNVLVNDSDPDGDVLTVAITRPPAGGSAQVNADKTITYRPDPSGSFPMVTFDYTVTDPGGRSATATVTVSSGPP